MCSRICLGEGVRLTVTTHDLIKKYLYDCIYSSVCVEGLGMTYPQTRSILDGHPAEGVTTDGVVFVVNMKRAWKFLEDNKDYPVNIMLLREYNKICGYGLINECGNIRTGIVRITGTEYVPPMPDVIGISKELKSLEALTDPIDEAIKGFMYVAKAQIFNDGNKRTAQMIANHILVSHDCGILKIPDVRVEEFTDALIDHYEGRSSGLYNYLLEECVIKSSVPEYVMYGNDKFTVDEICNYLPPFIVNRYTDRRTCAEEHVEEYVKVLKGE